MLVPAMRTLHTPPFVRTALALVLTVACSIRWTRAADAPAPARPFGIQVVDEQTGRGVPLVELTTVSNLRFVTDSAGWVAITDPALLGRKIFFAATSHGYEFPADGFGMRGRALDVKPGGTETLKIKRLNVAERLYRATGEGIYADSVVLGRKPPIAEPLVNAEVAGQDSTQRVVYRGKVYWFWGDTSRQRYPLGHFGMAGATSDLPSAGGLSPDVGVDYRYFVDKDGFSRPMFEREGPLLQWADGLFVLKGTDGRERLLGAVSVRKSLEVEVGRRLVELDDERGLFRTLRELPMTSNLKPNGPTFIAARDGKPFVSDGKAHVYFCRPLPDVRVPADLDSVTNPDRYEAFTCLAEGESAAGPDAKLDRDANGKLVWAWKRRTVPVDADDVAKWVKAGKMKAEEAWLRPTDASTGEAVRLHAGSVAWNAYRNKWVMIANQIGGKPSMLGEVFYLEADAPEGPWARAVKVVTHDRYSFYNPVHHPFFDRENGRYIYFEGTYSAQFSREGGQTPRYDYNQVMYKLDLKDERLARSAARP